MNEDKDNDCLDPENKSKCCFFKVANAFLLLAVFLQSVILFFYAPRVINGESLGFDYIGVIIGILTLLVTLLVAWNIWVTITSREEIKEMRENTERVMTKNNRLQHLIEQERHQCEGLRWHIEGKNFLADSAKDIKAPHMAYTHLARALEHYIYAFQSDLMYINDTLENMGASITNAQNEPLAAEQFRFHEDECNRLENVILDILHLLGNQSRRIRNEFEGIRQKRRQVTSNAQLHHP